MPYRASGNAVQEFKNNTWHTLKKYTGKNARKKALAYLAALVINTGHK